MWVGRPGNGAARLWKHGIIAWEWYGLARLESQDLVWASAAAIGRVRRAQCARLESADPREDSFSHPKPWNQFSPSNTARARRGL